MIQQAPGRDSRRCAAGGMDSGTALSAAPAVVTLAATGQDVDQDVQRARLSGSHGNLRCVGGLRALFNLVSLFERSALQPIVLLA